MNTDKPAVQQCNLNGQLITIRPISLDDVELESAFVRNLSAETKHYRFFSRFKELSAEQIHSLCSVDGEDVMAFIATVNDDGKEREIGVARYAKSAELAAHEMAVTVADAWLNKGLDKMLTEHLIDYARLHGVTKLISVELYDNAPMRQLATELGMGIKTDPDDIHQVIYSLPLQQ